MGAVARGVGRVASFRFGAAILHADRLAGLEIEPSGVEADEPGVVLDGDVELVVDEVLLLDAPHAPGGVHLEPRFTALAVGAGAVDLRKLAVVERGQGDGLVPPAFVRVAVDTHGAVAHRVVVGVGAGFGVGRRRVAASSEQDEQGRGEAHAKPRLKGEGLHGGSRDRGASRGCMQTRRSSGPDVAFDDLAEAAGEPLPDLAHARAVADGLVGAEVDG